MHIVKGKETPLHIAARIKDGEKCAEMLIKSGADVKAKKEVRKVYSIKYENQSN